MIDPHILLTQVNVTGPGGVQRRGKKKSPYWKRSGLSCFWRMRNVKRARGDARRHQSSPTAFPRGAFVLESPMKPWPDVSVQASAQITALAMEAGIKGRPMPKIRAHFLPVQLLHINTVYDEARRLHAETQKVRTGR